MKCPQCDIEMIEPTKGSGNWCHPGKPENGEDCPVMYYSTSERRLWFVPGHDPRFVKVSVNINCEPKEPTLIYKPELKN